MISINDLEELIKNAERLIETLDEEKKRRVKELIAALTKSIKRYVVLEEEIDDQENPPADFSAALTNLRELERGISLLESELRRILGSKEPRSAVRDPSDIGTVGGNGGVIFRPQREGYIVQEGALTQEVIVRLKKCIESKGKNFKEEFQKKGDDYKNCLNTVQQELKKKS